MDDPRADRSGVLVFPPLLFGAPLLVGLLLHWLAQRRPFPPLPSRLAGGLLVAASAALALWGERTMHRAGTNVNPYQPSLAIVTDGPFRFTRNPLYLALTALYLGITLLFDALWPLLLLVPVLLVLHFGVVLREERYLEEKFGDPYREYQGRVRRYL